MLEFRRSVIHSDIMAAEAPVICTSVASAYKHIKLQKTNSLSNLSFAQCAAVLLRKVSKLVPTFISVFVVVVGLTRAVNTNIKCKSQLGAIASPDKPIRVSKREVERYDLWYA